MECLVFFSSRRRHTRFDCDWSSDVCSSDLVTVPDRFAAAVAQERQRIRSALELMRQVSLACEAHGITFLFPKAFQDYPDFGDDVDLLVLPRSTRVDRGIVGALPATPVKRDLGERLAGATPYRVAACPTSPDGQHGR